MIYKLTKNKRTKRDILIMILIVITPFLFFLYNIVPEDQKWETSWFTIDSGLFENADYYVWLFFIRFLTIVILCLWFLTSIYKWKYILLVPLFLEINEISIILRETKVDQTEGIFFTSICTVLFSILFFLLLLWINNKLAYGISEKSINTIINEEINSEIVKLSIFDIKTYESVNIDLEQLENEKMSLSKTEYLTKLISLRDRLS